VQLLQRRRVGEQRVLLGRSERVRADLERAQREPVARGADARCERTRLAQERSVQRVALRVDDGTGEAAPAVGSGGVDGPELLLELAQLARRLELLVLAKDDSRVQRLLETYKDDGRVVDEMFLGTISREPAPDEKELAVSALAKDRVEGAQNLQWALLNLVEFLYNF
jgi:hypothetical protein